MALGMTFAPGSGESGNGDQPNGPAPSPVQQAIQLLSLRLPRVAGASSPAPQALLGGRGAMPGQGGAGLPGPTGNPIVQQLLMAMLGGQAGGGGAMRPPGIPLDWVSVGGQWVPPGHPLALGGGGSGGGGPIPSVPPALSQMPQLPPSFQYGQPPQERRELPPQGDPIQQPGGPGGQVPGRQELPQPPPAPAPASPAPLPIRPRTPFVQPSIGSPFGY